MGEEPDLCCKNAGSTANTEVGVAYGKMRMTPSYEAATEEKLHPCFLYDPANVGNLICGSSAFSKTSLNIWKFTVHILLKPGWRILSITLLACEMSAIVW